MSLPVDIVTVRAEMEEKRCVREEERVCLAAEEDARMEAELKELERQEVARLEETRKEEGKRKAEEARLVQEEPERMEREKREAETVVHRPRPVVPGSSRSPAKPAPRKYCYLTFYVDLVNLFSRGDYPKAGQRRKRRC